MNHSPIQRFHSQSKLQNTFYSLSILAQSENFGGCDSGQSHPLKKDSFRCGKEQNYMCMNLFDLVVKQAEPCA